MPWLDVLALLSQDNTLDCAAIDLNRKRGTGKGNRSSLPERPGGCRAQNANELFFRPPDGRLAWFRARRGPVAATRVGGNMSGTIVVIGSSNVDLIMKMSHLPQRGETVTDAVFLQTFGGKGANQAVAAASLPVLSK